MEQSWRLFPSRVICFTNPARIARSPVLVNYYLILESLLPWTGIREGGPVANAEVTGGLCCRIDPCASKGYEQMEDT